MKNTFLILLALVLITKTNAQSNPFKKVGNDLPYPALDACFDGNNVLYATCASPDSLFVYHLNNISNVWEEDARIKFKNRAYSNLSNQNAKCFVLNSTVFVGISDGSDSARVYKINPDKSSTLMGVLYNSYGGIFTGIVIRDVEQYNNKVVLTGNFNTVSGSSEIEKLITFDGTAFSTLNTNWGIFEDVFIENDTLYYERFDTIFAYNLNNNTKSQFYLTNQPIRSLTGSAGMIYYTDESGNLYKIKKNTLIEKTNTLNLKGGVNTFENRSFFLSNRIILDINYAYGRNELYVKDGSTMKGLRTPDYVKDLDNDNIRYVKLISDQNSNLFMISSAERTFQSMNYNIFKFNIDSLNSFAYDSIYLRTFGDKDKNGQLNTGDEMHSSIGYIMVNEVHPFFDFSGSDYKKIVLPDYRNYKFSAFWDILNPSCYEMPILGSYVTNNLIPGKTLDTLNFPMVLKGNGTDKKVKFVTSSRARLNDTINNRVSVLDHGCNQSNTSAFAKVILSPNTVFVSADYKFQTQNGDTLVFKIDSINSTTPKLFNFKTKYTNVDFKIDDVAVHKVILTQSNTNNQNVYSTDSIQVTMVYSYDPNVKISQPGGSVYTDANKFRYTIHFQNEGNDDARDVTIVDNLDSRFKPNSIKMIEASHAYTFSLFKNTITWEFKNINLKPKSTNEALSSGYLVFEIEKTAIIKVGDSIRNKAEIYFDLNAPIITNYATMRVVDKDTNNVDIGDVLNNGFADVFPNPSLGEFTLKLKNVQAKGTYEVINQFGQLVESNEINSAVSHIKIESKGIYFIRIIAEDKVLNIKVLVL